MIYFDNAATTMRKPSCVVQAVTEAMCSLGNSGRGVHSGALTASRIIYNTRAALAQLFGAESPERIAFTANATESLNIAIKGVLSAGDHVITTALEHNSVLRPLFELEDRGMELTILNADSLGDICCEDFEKEIRPNTKAIVTTHGSNLTGNLLPIGRIGAIARKHGLVYIVMPPRLQVSLISMYRRCTLISSVSPVTRAFLDPRASAASMSGKA